MGAKEREEWREILAKAVQALRKQKKRLGLCRVLFCTADAGDEWHCERHKQRHSERRKGLETARCTVCGEPRRKTETGVCRTCTLLGRE